MATYGRGMTGVGELRCDGKLTRGLEAVIRDVYNMLVTVRGSLPADPEAGLGLLDRILGETTEESIPAIGSDIEGELAKDDRIDDSNAQVTVEDGVIVIDLTVELKSGSSFRLVGPIGAVRVELLNNGN